MKFKNVILDPTPYLIALQDGPYNDERFSTRELAELARDRLPDHLVAATCVMLSPRREGIAE